MNPKNRLRLALCVGMLCLAGAMAAFTVGSFQKRTGSGGFQGYILGESEGRVAVYDALDRSRPLTVTDIELSSLRESDRVLLLSGIQTDTAEELAELLEDLGS